MSVFTRIVELSPESPDTGSAVRELTLRQNELFATIVDQVRPGMTSSGIADIARAEAARARLDFSFRTALGFPDDISVSVGSTIINGVPDTTVVKEGDIVRLALGTQRNGTAFSVQNWSFCVGRADPEGSALLSAVQAAVDEGVRQCHPGTTYSELAETLQRVSQREKFHLSGLFRGNQIGRQPVIGPPITRPQGIIKRDMRLVPGVFLSFFVLGHAAEPKLSESGKWALRDRERFPACFFSHVVEVTAGGPERLSAAYPLIVAGPTSSMSA